MTETAIQNEPITLYSEPVPDDLAVGDLVQWTSAGTDQFVEGRIKALSPDGWAFVEGSDTGIPITELTRWLKPTHTRSPANDSRAGNAALLRYVQVPCNLLGLLLDHGRASAYAAHLLAIKCCRDDFVLNERYVAREHGISRRAFQAGMRLMKRTGVLERSQRGRRSFANEALVNASERYVPISEDMLKADSSVVALVLVVNLSPDPQPPARAAIRIGVRQKGRGTMRKLVKAALEHSSIATGTGSRGAVLVARRGFKFDLVKNEPAKNEPAKNDAAHSKWKTATENERDSLGERTRSGERAAPEDDFFEHQEESAGARLDRTDGLAIGGVLPRTRSVRGQGERGDDA